MFKLIDDFNRSDAGTLSGVQICAVIVGLGAVVAVLGCALFGLATFLALTGRTSVSFTRSFSLMLCCLALTYVLIHICVGLFNGTRFAQLGGIAWGVLLLLFCWMLAHDARQPSDPKAPDAQELDGPMFLVSAPTALWLIGYLSTKRVSARFQSPRAES